MVKTDSEGVSAGFAVEDEFDAALLASTARDAYSENQSVSQWTRIRE